MSSRAKFKKTVLTSVTLSETLPIDLWLEKCSGRTEVSECEDIFVPMSDVYVSNLPKLSIILNPDGLIWMHGSLYLLSRALDYNSIVPESIDSIARDLVHLRNTLEEHDLDYLDFPLNLLRRPTYAYAALLKEKTKRKTSADVERRQLSSMQGLYRWMKRNDPDFRPQFPMWIDEIRHVSYLDDEGNTLWKEIVTNDLRIKHAGSVDLGTINDGGKLHPLLPHEVESVLRALANDGNVEMMLIFAIALTSGARIQTILTMRVGDICVREYESTRLIPTKCGGGSLIDTKKNKSITIFIPLWVHRKLGVYVRSRRYSDRLSRSGYENNKESYVFLTTSAKPYYMSRLDPNYATTPQAINGGSVRTYLMRLKSKILETEGKTIDFSFHDLRATFGMGLLNELMEQVNDGKRTLSSALNYVKRRMCHSRLETTMNYFKHYEDAGAAYDAQVTYEKHVESIMYGKE